MSDMVLSIFEVDDKVFTHRLCFDDDRAVISDEDENVLMTFTANNVVLTKDITVLGQFIYTTDQISFVPLAAMENGGDSALSVKNECEAIFGLERSVFIKYHTSKV